MELTGHNLIGQELSAKGTITFQAKNALNLSFLDTTFTEATPEEVDLAVKKAEASFSPFTQKSNNDRAAFLEAIGEEILKLGDSLIARCMAETALPEARLTGERMRTINQLRLFASVIREGSWVNARIDTALPDRQPLPRPDIRQMQVPLGPVGIFGASNFPLAFSVAGGDTASALAAGCPVVVKAHPLHPGTSALVGSAILKAAKETGMPEGVFSLVHGEGAAVGMAIVNHPLIKAIGFTGSFKGGKAIFDAANSRSVPIPVFAEMGSSNPVFILPNALKERQGEIAKGLAASLALGVGQFCTNPGLVISEMSSVSKNLLDELAIIISGQPCGLMLSEGIKNNYLRGIKALSETEGVALLSAGKGDEEGNKARSRIFTTDAAHFLNNARLAEEVFGPSTLHVATRDKEEIMQVAAKLEGHLTATILGTEEDLTIYEDLIRLLERKVGRLIFNGYPTGVEVSHAMVHGGPFPATTAPQTTSVGSAALYRFSRMVCYQDFPQQALPKALRNANPLEIWRMVNGELSKAQIR